MAQEYNGLCSPNENIITHFKELIDEDNAENVELFINNLKKNFLRNYLFERGKNFSLGYACKQGKYNVALKFVEIGLREPNVVNLGESDADGKTPLIECCNSDDEMSIIVVKELLKGNCRPEATYGENNKSALMRACDYKEDASLLILNELLNFDYNLGFQLDSNGESGIMYLFNYLTDQDKSYFLKNKLYIKVCVNYLKIYFIHDPNNDNFESTMDSICNDPELRRAFSTPLLKVTIPESKKGIDLNDYCLNPARATEILVHPMTASIESISKPRKRLDLDLPEAEEIPLEIGERVEGVSPGGRWVSSEDARRYIRLYPPGKGPNGGPGSDPAGGKKRNTTKKSRLKRNKNKKLTRRIR
jgi:hypothetical protein